jgi:hypothetical protein
MRRVCRMGRMVTMSKIDQQKLMKSLERQPVVKTRVEKGTPKKTKRGKPINMYMHPDDVARIRTLAAYLGTQGKRVSDSQVVKAALRVAKQDGHLLAAFEETLAIDQRFKHSKV